MKIKTTRFGEIEIEPEKIITMTQGMLGFEQFKRYIILDHHPDTPFKWWQSIDDPGLAFVIVDPLLFKTDYEVTISREEAADLNLEDTSKGTTIVVLSIPKGDPAKISANLMAPLIINHEHKLAKQIVLINSSYPTRFYLLPHTEKDGQSSSDNQTVSS